MVIDSAQVSLSPLELNSMIILATEWLRRDAKGIHTNESEHTQRNRQLWLKACNGIVCKASDALNECILAGEMVYSEDRR